jgi:hypothetical protein
MFLKLRTEKHGGAIPAPHPGPRSNTRPIVVLVLLKLLFVHNTNCCSTTNSLMSIILELMQLLYIYHSCVLIHMCVLCNLGRRGINLIIRQGRAAK